MPELPEVETVRRILAPQVTGRRITALEMNRPEVIAHPTAEDFKRIAIGAEIENMGRRGKFLTLGLRGGDTMILHLRMTGQLLATPPDFPALKHTHIVFSLSDGQELRFIDARRFGRFWLLQNGEEDGVSGIAKLGPEPFDAAFGGAYLQAKLAQRRRPLKACLLDQSIVAGIGNIYGDEILFAAGLHPARAAASLCQCEWEALAAAIPAVLQKAIADEDLTPGEYLAGLGEEYRDAPGFQVYGREGQACPRCGAPLKRMALAGRSSFYCPRCQA